VAPFIWVSRICSGLIWFVVSTVYGPVTAGGTVVVVVVWAKAIGAEAAIIAAIAAVIIVLDTNFSPW
jgi:hypothetical protein